MANSAPSWITYVIQSATDIWRTYVDPTKTVETEEEETSYVTQVYDLGPLYPQKYILVSEILQYCSTAELSEGYHTPQEYAEANTRFGNIFKHQKFENADSVETLHEYAIDWIKNNYHGGLTSFDITAIDMKLLNEDVDPYIVGDKIDVCYPDVFSHTEITKTLTCISAEYDLYNPDKNRYKIGVPDAALNKAYGETAKSGGGGGGGGNTEDENDEEDATEQESWIDRFTRLKEWLEENSWSFAQKKMDDGEPDPDFDTPKNRDATNPFTMNLMSDNVKSGTGIFAELQSRHFKSDYMDISGVLNSRSAKLEKLVLDSKEISRLRIPGGDGEYYEVLGIPASANEP